VSGERRLTDDLTSEELAVLEALPSRGAAGVATIAAEAHVELDTAITMLGRLLYSGHVERTGDGWRLTRETIKALRRR
jgi:DNA processing protein